jgi:hypothetical protein
MSNLPFARRYWNRLTAAGASGGSPAAGRGRTGYGFWQRYWAAFIAADLPVRQETASAGGGSPAAVPRSPGSARLLTAAGQERAGWFTLAPLPGPAGLRAGDDDDVIVEMASPDGRVEFFVRRSGIAPDLYRIEVVVRDADALPAVIIIRYETADEEQLLLVPVTAQNLGPAVSQVELPGIQPGRNWEASGPLRIDPAAWDEDTVTRSVHAAVNEATRNAWRQVGDTLAEPMKQMINRALQ